MKFLLPLKILVLVAALGGVFYAIHRVNSGSMEHAFQVLGIQEGNGETPGFQPSHRAIVAGEVAFNLCPNRVKAIVWSDHKVEELRNGMKVSWMAYDPAARELGYLAVEKWFSNHCQIFVTPEPASVAASSAVKDQPAPKNVAFDLVVVRYIDGTEMNVQRLNDGSILATRAGEKSNFRSSDLTDALHELEVLAQFPPRADSSIAAPVPNGQVPPVAPPGAKAAAVSPVVKPTPKMMRATVDHLSEPSTKH